MNQGVKRYRQISIMESFASSKRQKSASVVEAANNQAIADSSVNKSLLENPSNLREAEVDAYQSCKISPSSMLEKGFCEASGAKSKENSCDVSPRTKSIIDRLWEFDVEDNQTENENIQSKQENPELKSKKKQTYEEEDGYRSSADLFPEEQSFTDDPMPSGGSQDLFDSQKELFESQSPEETEDIGATESSSESEPDNVVILNRSPDCDMPLPNLEPSENHSIMFSPHIRPGDAPRPFPKQYRDKWDSDHVRMPCSPLNRYPIENSMGETIIGSRWDLICQSLMADIGSSEDLEKAIMKYNTQHIGKWNFLGLHSLINEHWSEEERDHFFENLLPSMIEMALNLPYICTQPVPLLKQGKDHYVTMSQKQIGCLMLNAFFCTFPRRNPRYRQRLNSEYSSYPDINFNRLFYGTKRGCPPRSAEKLKCLFNYFRRITSKEPCGTVTFHRQVIPIQNLPNWYSSTRGIKTAVIKSHGLIEDDGHGLLQVDFANKFVGGGVLGQGCVQEEIRFVCCPELIVSRLFVESLENNEALIITGAEQYNKYSGYGDTFKWDGDFRDNTPRDSWGRRCTKIVAIDAVPFKKTSDQFTFQCFKRELNKAYCGFYENTPPNHLPAVATGNWGCGAFKGSADLKFLIQLMAASECCRNLVYYTFQNKKLKRELQEMYTFLTEKNLTVGDLWRLLINYSNKLSTYNDAAKPVDLYPFIYSQFQMKKSFCKQRTLDCYKVAESPVENLTEDASQKSDDIT